MPEISFTAFQFYRIGNTFRIAASMTTDTHLDGTWTSFKGKFLIWGLYRRHKDPPNETVGCNDANVFGFAHHNFQNAKSNPHTGIVWAGFKGYRHSLKRLHMKVRPRNFHSSGTKFNYTTATATIVYPKSMQVPTTPTLLLVPRLPQILQITFKKL